MVCCVVSEGCFALWQATGKAAMAAGLDTSFLLDFEEKVEGEALGWTPRTGVPSGMGHTEGYLCHLNPEQL